MSAHETTVGDGAIERAKAIRAERDAFVGNAFPAEGPDLRWIGDLGELVFARWLDHHGLDFKHDGDVNFNPDFIANGCRLALKTAEAQQRHVCAAERHARRKGFDHLVFASYAVTRRRWRLLGAIVPDEFISIATLRPAKTPDGKPYFLLAPDRLYPPDVLLTALRFGATIAASP